MKMNRWIAMLNKRNKKKFIDIHDVDRHDICKIECGFRLEIIEDDAFCRGAASRENP
jgi:hypothetical protein